MELSDIKKLSAVLQENGDKILDGSSKLIISVNLLQYLNESFNLIVDSKDPFNLTTTTPTTFQVINTSNSRLEIFRDLQFLHDFIQKTIGLKISTNNNLFVIPTTEPFDGTADVSKFRSLKLLEIRKIPVTYLTGIKHLRSQVQCIICVKAIEKSMEEILVECGGDRSEGEVWKELREASFSHNNLFGIGGLEFVPYLQVLDLSHNKLKDAQALDCLHSLKHLNLSYNRLERLPLFSSQQSNKLQSIVAKNNYIEDLTGLFTLVSLQELDVSCNCLIDHSTLCAIPKLANLQILSLEGNPLSCHPLHRKFTCRYLHSNTASVKFVLDRNLLSSTEKMQIGTYFTNSVRLPAHLREHIFNSSVTTLSDSYTSTPIASDSVRVKGSRKPSRRVRQAVISDTDTTDETFSEAESRFQTSVQVESFTEESLESSIEHLSTKKQIEDLREKYGDYWLHSKGGSSLVQDVLGMEKTEIPDIPSFYETSLATSPESIQTMLPENESEYKTIGDTTEEMISTDYYSVLETSYESTETTTEVEEDEDDKTEEEEDDVNCKLFIVQIEKASGNLDQLFLCVSLDSKIMRERNSTTGVIKERWTFSILESCEQTEKGVLLKFDTVKRDKQTRNYIVEDETDRQNLVELLRNILDARSLKETNQSLFRCMRCSTEFTEEKLDNTRTVFKNESIRECPSCKCTIVMEVEEETPLKTVTAAQEVPTECAEIALPQSPSHSSIANNDEQPTGVVTPRLVKVTADVHIPAANPQSNVKSSVIQPCSATSLDDSLTSSKISGTKRGDSDIEVLSDPSQDSIEVLAVLARGSSLTRRNSSEERRLDAVTSILSPVKEKELLQSNLIASTIAAGLTESSSSDSLTDSICTAYEKQVKAQSSEVTVGGSNVSETTIVNEEVGVVPSEEVSEPKEAESVKGIGILSSMLEGLWGAGNFLSMGSPSKNVVNEIPPDNVDSVKFSYTDFAQIDYRVKLHLFVNIFDEETEEPVWLLRTEILTHNAEESFSGCIVLSTFKLYILKIDNVVHGGDPEQWLKKHEVYTVDRLQKVFTLPWKQGLGIEIRQSSLMGVESSVYVLCFLQDLMRTTNFLAHLSDVTLPDTCDLITKQSQRTELNVQQLILSTSSQPDSDFTIRLFHIFSGCEIRQNGSGNSQDLKMGVLIVTNCDLILTQDSMGWLQPDSVQSPLICTTQQLINLVEAERSDFTIKLIFLDESVQKEETWLIKTVSKNAVDNIVEALRAPWESLFSVTFNVRCLDTEET